MTGRARGAENMPFRGGWLQRLQCVYGCVAPPYGSNRPQRFIKPWPEFTTQQRTARCSSRTHGDLLSYARSSYGGAVIVCAQRGDLRRRWSPTKRSARYCGTGAADIDWKRGCVFVCSCVNGSFTVICREPFAFDTVRNCWQISVWRGDLVGWNSWNC